MSTNAKKPIDLDAVVAQLVKSTDRPASEIKAEIEGLMQKFKYNTAGAIAVWKTTNKFLIAVDRIEYNVRVIAKEQPRATTNKDGTTNLVGNIHFIYVDPESKQVAMNQTTAWGQPRIDTLYQMFQLGKAYKFKAKLNDKKLLAWIRNIEPSTAAVPEIAAIEALPIAEVADVVDQYEFVRGFIGKVISQGGQKIGIEIDDGGAAPPLTIWFAGKFTKMSPEDVAEVQSRVIEGMQVAAYGYISGAGTDVRMSASSIWFL